MRGEVDPSLIGTHVKEMRGCMRQLIQETDEARRGNF